MSDWADFFTVGLIIVRTKWTQIFKLFHWCWYFEIWGSSPTGAHFGPKKGYKSGSLLRQAGCNIVICELYYSVIEKDFYKKIHWKKCLFRQCLDFAVLNLGGFRVWNVLENLFQIEDCTFVLWIKGL